ncbi:nose resistant to fluoxetine protein 6-like isoform X1 [Sitophilus oryzae]|uniref:Nose resistant to fluoxetine protein 6-like isoform X1 n=2 Tax=Sitophilus oryzae TaxID=7048 RepID=A0A6J2Y1C2_SITOR|nr:nose resistant to fluoxetine protein 6-like isoform X1 [Sitophilus oryzae]
MLLLSLVLSFLLMYQGNCIFLEKYTSDPANFVKSVLNKVNRSEISLESECLSQLGQFVDNLQKFDDGLWALRMIDATAKWPAGIAKINWAWLGSFDECLEIESKAKDVRGSYCLISISLEKLTTMTLRGVERQRLIADHKRKGREFSNTSVVSFLPSFGICVPNKCTSDIESIIDAFDDFTSMPFDVMCQTKDDNVEIDIGAIITIGFFGAFIALMLLSTAYDTYYQFQKQVKPHPILASFSVYSNGKSLFHIAKKTELSCLNGIRFLSMMWVVQGHVASMAIVSPLDNLYDIFEYLQQTRSLFYVSGTLSVDSFFFLSGFLLVYVFMKSMKAGTKFNIIYFYVHRYLRLTIPFIPVILVFTFLAKYFGSGPLYPQIDASLGNVCRKNWWKSILYIQNFFGEYVACNEQTWYLNVDWQLYLVSPIILLLLYKIPLIGVPLIGIISLASMIGNYIITTHYQLPALLSNFRNFEDYFLKFYVQPYTRAPPYLIGTLVGYYVAQIKIYKTVDFRKTPRIVIYGLWVTILAVMPICVFAGMEQLNNADYNAVANSLHNALVKPTWALCLGWIVIACANGYGGIIDGFLSLPIFQVLSKFTYAIYLLHYGLANIIMANAKGPIHFSEFNLLYSFWSLFMLSFGLSVFWVLAFESPIVILDKYLSGRGRSKSHNTNKVGEGNLGEVEVGKN